MCFPLGAIEHIVILCIIGCAIAAILATCLPFASGFIGANVIQMLVNVFWIIFKAILAILCVIILFAMIGCLLSYAHF